MLPEPDDKSDKTLESDKKPLGVILGEHGHSQDDRGPVERLAIGAGGKRRGRPPKWTSVVSGDTAQAVAPSAKRTVSAAARKRMAAAQKKRWAEKKAQATEAGS
jgi:hypothetical protein